MNLYQPANGATIGQAQDMIFGSKPVELTVESEGNMLGTERQDDIDETD